MGVPERVQRLKKILHNDMYPEVHNAEVDTAAEAVKLLVWHAGITNPLHTEINVAVDRLAELARQGGS